MSDGKLSSNEPVAFYRTDKRNVYLAGEDRVILPYETHTLEVKTKNYAGGFIPVGFFVEKTPKNASERYWPMEELVEEVRLIDPNLFNQLALEFMLELDKFKSAKESLENTYTSGRSAANEEYLAGLAKLESDLTEGRKRLGVPPRLEEKVAKLIHTLEVRRRSI